ncbi:cyclic nucleotide-binding domain-containing protein [Pseudonocardia sp.]|uniref:cyclic nucleotide-binding domain-containing protein n=1 Tax=Pseudonocardia sp. TaxID=60912 RepID=UPI002605AF1E|nr:cyclic nucleotide-binding domain-containing protein [Pseudonocardia sp.]
MWIIRSGHVELSVTSSRNRVVVGVLRPGDVEGDIPLLLGLPLPYAARAVDAVTCLQLSPPDFEDLLARHPAIARRWLSSRLLTDPHRPREATPSPASDTVNYRLDSPGAGCSSNRSRAGCAPSSTARPCTRRMATPFPGATGTVDLRRTGGPAPDSREGNRGGPLGVPTP